MTEAVMMYFNLKKKTFIKCNFNNIVIKDIMSQINNKGWL